MSARCSICGSYALNVARESGLCDLHFYKVQRDELLAALQGFVNHGTCFDERDMTAARAAIAKATGAAA